MEITGVKIKKTENGGSLMAIAEITLDDELTIRDIRLIDGKNGWFVAMPNRKGSDGKYYDIVVPNDRATQDLISDTIMKAYTQAERKQEERV